MVQHRPAGKGHDRRGDSPQPGTLYGTLSKMEKDGLIEFVREEDKRKIYQITELGMEVLELELKRIQRLYRNAREVL